MMILLIDDRRFIAQSYADALRQLGHEIEIVVDPTVVTKHWATEHLFDVALVDLSFPEYEPITGLDVLVALHDVQPSCKLAVLTQGDGPFQTLLRITWDALPLAAVLSKDLVGEQFTEAIRTLETGDTVFVDAVLQLFLPIERRPERALGMYAHPMPRARYAKLWLALAESDERPTQKELGTRLGVKHNTIKNYLADIGPYLGILGDPCAPTLEDMHRFARLARPILIRSADLEHGIPQATT